MVFSVFSITDVFASTDTFDRAEDNNYLIKKEYNIDDKMLKSILSTPAVDATEKIYDFADLYTADEEKELYSIVSKYIENYNFDFAIVTTNNNTKSSTKAYAQDFYDYNDFGIDTDYSGILFLIDMDKRNFQMITTGAAIKMYTDTRIDICLDEAMEYISSGDYYDGTVAFVEKVDSYASIGFPDEFGNEPKLSGVSKLIAMPWMGICIFALGGTGVVMLVFVLSSKNVHKATSSQQYLTKSDAKVIGQALISRNVHSTPRYDDSSSGGSGGGSSTSIGSSGTSHGGGGRSF